MTRFTYTFLVLYSVGSFGSVFISLFLNVITLVYVVLIALVKNIDNFSGHKFDLEPVLPLIMYASR